MHYVFLTLLCFFSLKFRSYPDDPTHTRYAVQVRSERKSPFFDIVSDEIEAQGYEVVVIDPKVWNSMTMSKPGAKAEFLLSQIGVERAWREGGVGGAGSCLLYTSPSPRDS